MTALVTLDRASLSAPDGHRLFNDLNLAIGRERTGLVGRNGCGKSTLLRLTVAQALGVADDLARLDRMAGGIGSLGRRRRRRSRRNCCCSTSPPTPGPRGHRSPGIGPRRL